LPLHGLLDLGHVELLGVFDAEFHAVRVHVALDRSLLYPR
jgi:hypothetical protein